VPGNVAIKQDICLIAQAIIKQALYFKTTNPLIDTMVLYTELRTPGFGGENFYRSGQDQGVTFTKGQASAVVTNGSQLTVKFKDLILNEEVECEADLVVLATGMIPNSGVNIEAIPLVIAPPKEGEVVAPPPVPAEPVDSVLNLNYRQGKDMPQLVNGFTDSHFICFPYETRRTGIYAAGPVRRPCASHGRCHGSDVKSHSSH